MDWQSPGGVWLSQTLEVSKILNFELHKMVLEKEKNTIEKSFPITKKLLQPSHLSRVVILLEKTVHHHHHYVHIPEDLMLNLTTFI